MDVRRRALAAPPWIREAWGDVWPVFLASRLVVLVAAAFAATLYGLGAEGPIREAPLDYAHPFDGWPAEGTFEFLLAPLARWDGIWYLAIAQDGYFPSEVTSNPGSKLAFFPLYPTLVRIVSVTGGDSATLVASLVVSLGSFLVALLLLHRLVVIELGSRFAKPAVALLAFSPVSFFFSAPYTESLFLALSLGAVLSARTGHWVWACVLAGVSTATRNTGILLFVPLGLLYLYGPRADRETAAAAARAGLRRLLPRHRPRPEVLAFALVPVGLVAFCAYLEYATGDAFAWRTTQAAFGRPETTQPLDGVVKGVEAGWNGLRDLHADAGLNLQNVFNLAFLVLGIAGIVGALRLLPVAYGAYLAAGVLVPLSAPALDEPLRTMPRFLLVLFPLWMWLAWVTVRRDAVQKVLLGSVVLLVLVTAAFATWRPWV